LFGTPPKKREGGHSRRDEKGGEDSFRGRPIVSLMKRVAMISSGRLEKNSLAHMANYLTSAAHGQRRTRKNILLRGNRWYSFSCGWVTGGGTPKRAGTGKGLHLALKSSPLVRDVFEGKYFLASNGKIRNKAMFWENTRREGICTCFQGRGGKRVEENKPCAISKIKGYDTLGWARCS